MTVLNGTVAWDLEGNRDETRCIDIAPLLCTIRQSYRTRWITHKQHNHEFARSPAIMKPIVVTANDVYAGLKARAKEQSKRQAEQLAKYKEVKAKVIPERLFRKIAIERIIGKDYHNLKKRHQRILDALKPREKKYIELKDVPYKQKKEFYLSYSDKLR